ncbi:hypothetical protein HDV03_003676 [Kappamyces sp. JEL0829]|nr:hypothetical protein HDV03_003676 [Kappamyces sp. JEL0829]
MQEEDVESVLVVSLCLTVLFRQLIYCFRASNARLGTKTLVSTVVALLTFLQLTVHAVYLLNQAAGSNWRWDDQWPVVALGIAWAFQLLHLARVDGTFSYSLVFHIQALAAILVECHRSMGREQLSSAVFKWSAAAISAVLFSIDAFKPSGLAIVEDGQRPPCPESIASPWQIVSFSWIMPLLQLGIKRPLEEEDLPDLDNRDKMHSTVTQWTAFSQSGTIFWNIIKFTWKHALFQVSLATLVSLLQFTSPLFTNLILKLLQAPRDDNTLSSGFLLISGMFLFTILNQILSAQISLNDRHWTMKVRSILVYEIFKKSLCRTNAATFSEAAHPATMSKKDLEKLEKASQGKIASLMSRDVGQVTDFLTDFDSILIDLPISLVVSVTGVIYLMGLSGLAGLVVILLSGPASTWATSRLLKSGRVVRKKVDARLQVVNETFQSIRIIKYLGWDETFLDRILKARDDELKARWSQRTDMVVMALIGQSSSILITFVSFFFYTVRADLAHAQVVAGHKLDAATAFTSISLMNMLNSDLNGVGRKISRVLDVKVTMERITYFLQEQELDKFSADSHHRNRSKDTWIGISEGNFVYYGAGAAVADSDAETAPLLPNGASSSVPAFALRNINVEFPRGSLTAIIGPTGSGKSSLLLTLLGEMKQESGHYSIPEHHLQSTEPTSKSDVAYVSQTVWLMNDTIRSNILFGEPYDEERYYRVLEGCALLHDLETLQYGDLTQIGEKGVNLSGGQKQRVSLARASYSSASIVLLDDPLSAVDAPTARHLLNHCILELLRGRTILLVTHAVNLVLPRADQVLVVRNGSISAAGTPEVIMQTEGLAEMSQEPDDAPSELTATEEKLSVKSIVQTDNLEGKATGKVKPDTYLAYIRAAGGFWFGAATFGSLLMLHGASYLESFWLQYWTDKIEDNPNALQFIVVLFLIGCLDIFAFFIRFYTQWSAALRASKVIHERLARSILGCSMRFFEVTPVGRLLNRFDKDLSGVDGQIMSSFSAYYSVLISISTKTLVVCIVNPPFLVILFLSYFYWRIGRFFMASSLELKRINSVSSSPIYALFNEVLQGVSTIRAFGAEKQFIASIEERIDCNHRSSFYQFSANRWFAFRISVLSKVVVLIAGATIFISGLTAGWAGLLLEFASTIASAMGNVVRIQSNLELAMNAVERIEEYSHLEQEPQSQTLDDGTLLLAPADWPSEGKIEVTDLVVKYSPEMPEVLKGISFQVDPHEKVGIVGRTGAGKSTLSLAFFRILPLTSGSIVVDGIDIATLGVRDLRRHFSIIPQDPVLFEGTLRSNLDPTLQHSDEEIWNVLRQTHFMDSLQDSATQIDANWLSLDTKVSQGGDNYSQGQRQLLCLARAMLRSSRFIFLDEATASVDPKTDSHIQKVIRENFQDSTILTVAHRLKTIIDYDRVLVLDQGRVAEFGTPFELLKQQRMFHQLCKESGDYDDLFRMAHTSHH